MSMPNLLLRLEDLFILIASLVLFRHLDGRWALFALLFLAPDLSMLGYLANPRLGSILYNLVHSYSTVLLLALLAAVITRSSWLPWLCLLAAHIGFDRMLGYGLKYPSAFKDTHLQRV